MNRAAGFAFVVLAVLHIGVARVRAEGDGGLLEKYVLIMERIGADTDANKPDCDKIGTALSRHQAQDAATMKEFKDNLAKLPPSQRQAVKDLFKDKYAERLKASEAKAAPLKACKTHPKVKAYADAVMR